MSATIWDVRHPLTGATSEHETLALAVVWFVAETIGWLARRWLLPVLLVAVFAGLAVERGVRRAIREGRS